MNNAFPTDAFGRPVGMPVLIPIPIPTVGLPWYHALFNLLFYRRDYWLGEDFHYRLPTGEDVMIRMGFVFDGASIPRLFWSVLSPIGLLLIPGLLHDHAYKHTYLLAPDGTVAVRYTRLQADNMFLQVCYITNGMKYLDLFVSTILVIFGGWTWRKHRRKTEGSET